MTLTLFTVKPGMREKMEKLADEMAPNIRGMKGFKSITFFKDQADEFGGLSTRAVFWGNIFVYRGQV